MAVGGGDDAEFARAGFEWVGEDGEDGAPDLVGMIVKSKFGENCIFPETPPNSQEMNAFSYVRWSSAKQTDGDSFLRQTETARRVCREKGWNLVDLGSDAGVSAFKGKNLSHKGILGQFIKRVESGLIQTPCVLILEKLDRFSRNDVDEVLPVFLNLLKSGVEVYSALDNDHYTHAKIKDDPMVNILKLVMGFEV